MSKRKKRIPIDTAQAIRDARERAGMSQGDLAKLAGCEIPHISRWESGTVAISAKRWAELLAHCGMTVKITR